MMAYEATQPRTSWRRRAGCESVDNPLAPFDGERVAEGRVRGFQKEQDPSPDFRFAQIDPSP